MRADLKHFAAGFLAFTAISWQLSAQPANDLFSNRTSLTGTYVTVQSDNSGATTESGEPTASGFFFDTVWYEWTAPDDGIFYYSEDSPDPSLILDLQAYVGTAVNALTEAVTMPDGGIQVLQGDRLEIQIASQKRGKNPAITGEFTLTLSESVSAPLSGNDMFANRAEITTPTYHFDGGIFGATSEPGEPLPAANDTNTVWWDFVAPSDGVLSLTASSPAFTPVLTVYSGSSFATMNPVISQGSFLYQYSVNYFVQGGQHYSIQVATGYAASGQFSLDSQFNGQSLTPTNDMFASSAQIVGTNIAYYGNFASATSEPGEPASSASNTVWVSWAAPCTGRAYYIPPHSYQFQYVNVYTGPALALLQPVTVFEQNSVCSFLAIEGTVYYFQFSGGAATFGFPLWITPQTPAANDNFMDATLAGGNAASFGPASVFGATMEPGEPAHLGATPEKSIWWNWQAPEYGTMRLDPSESLASNVMVAVYTGNAVGTLTLVAKATNVFTFPVSAGQMYHIAGAVPADAVGDILVLGYLFSDTSVHAIPGNLLHEPSWEGTGILDAQYWQWSGPLGGTVNQTPGDCDGTTWPVLYSGASIWQSFPTIAGHSYAIGFGYTGGGQGGEGLVQVSWNSNVLGEVDLPAGNSGYWNWSTFLATASNTTSQVMFTSLGAALAMDDFSVVDQTASPAIVAQPSSQSTETGGTTAFFVDATGTLPLTYQWFFQSNALNGQTNLSLLLSNASTNQTGDYFVTVSNHLGAVTSQVVSLLVDAPSYPTIVLQPFGETVAQGGYFSFGVAALGTQPLSYQWSFNGSPVSGATNTSLTFTNVQPGNAGVYQVVVTNSAGAVLSLPAALFVSQSDQGGGTILFANQTPYGKTNANAPDFDLDGVTPLNGGCVAQLYAGPSLSLLRAVGVPETFNTGFNAGYFPTTVVTLPNVSPGSNATVQVRAWDPTAGGTYEQARALGGKFGKSGLLQITTGGAGAVPAPLAGLQSFRLQAGLPEFNVGVVQFMNLLPGGGAAWSLTGEPGYIYLVEVAAPDWVWTPYLVLTNTTGAASFTTSVNTNSSASFYRARILD